MSDYPKKIHVAEGKSEDCDSCWRRINEHDCGADEGSPKVTKAVRKPRQQVQDCVLVRGEDVAQICTVQDVLEGREDLDPDRRSPFGRDEPIDFC